MKKPTKLPAPIVKAAAGMPNSATIVAAGYNAWKELKRQKTYERWLSVGRALCIGRDICLNASGANTPKGQPYTGYFSEWLRCEGFDGISKSERRDLFKVMENESEITHWREGLDDDEKRRVNHPETVWRRWQAFVHKPAKPTAASKLFKEMKKMHNVDQGVREPSFEAEVARALETIEEITMTADPVANAARLLRQLRSQGLMDQADVLDHVKEMLKALHKLLADEEAFRAHPDAKKVL